MQSPRPSDPKGGGESGPRPSQQGSWQRPPWEEAPRRKEQPSHAPGARSIPLRPQEDEKPAPEGRDGARAQPARAQSASAAPAVSEGSAAASMPLEAVAAQAAPSKEEAMNELLASLEERDTRSEEPLVPAELTENLGITSLSPRHKVEAWLAVMVKSNASDLILRAGGRPSTRVDGRIGFLPGRVPNAGPLLEVLEWVMGTERMQVWRDTGSVDCALHLDGLGRFRINAYRQMGEPALVLRRVSHQAPILEDLELPTVELTRVALRRRGLVLVTGIAGSGKSTTLAALIQYMNLNAERHVVTLEDPIEILFSEKRCVISQREVGIDVPTFHEGLRHSLRQSPDVILIGEMRDQETVSAALDASETGHLVMSTMHTVNAAQTLDRILGFYPAEQHKQIRMRLADNLACVLSQRLIPRSAGKGMVPACEMMTSTPRIRELLEEGDTGEIARTVDGGSTAGLISFNQSLRRLVQHKLVDLRDALAASDRPDELVLALRGITSGMRKRPGESGSPPPARAAGGE
ncbi:MAG TPA: PilT/PilU family type 4a pilus ATPase [Planctomycetota bacterium]|nr:PilT/PilU family type 4a pilus ATPase [Planctomycetota bacterium]